MSKIKDSIQIENSWKEALSEEFDKDYFGNIVSFLKQEKAKGKTIFPPGAEIFSAFNTTPFSNVKVVILGQDPYHGEGQAHGLCFSVKPGVKAPPSLVNIYKELQTDLDLAIPNHGYLQSWAKQGVFMINAMLTVEAHKPASHSKIGWNHFTDSAIKKLSDERKNLVFILWGNFAKQKSSLIDSSKHLVLTAAHPSPFSAYNGFFGCKHFSQTNEYLKSVGKEPINWQV